MSTGGRTSTPGVHEDDLVTGDAVALQVPSAGPGLRLLSGLVDLAVYGAVLIGGLILLFGLVETADEALSAAIVLSLSVLVTVLLPLVVEVATRGRSLGRVVTGTRIVRTDGGPVAPRQSLVRALVGVVELWGTTGAVAGTAVLLTARSQRLGDLAAGTYSVRDRMRLVLPPPLTPVPHLEGWARAADIAPLPDDLALGVRQLLQRRETLLPDARARLADELAAAVATRVSPQPPAGTHPEDFLRAVVAERGRRDYARMGRDAALRDRLHLS